MEWSFPFSFFKVKKHDEASAKYLRQVTRVLRPERFGKVLREGRVIYERGKQKENIEEKVRKTFT